MFQRRRGGQGNFGVMLLALQLMNFGFDKIPPVTLVAILSQTAIFLGIGDLTRWFPSSSGVCLSTHFVWRQGQWSRLILGQLFHSTDMHLYFNMVSLLWKGNMLERKFKSVYFAYLLTVFTILTGIMIVGLNFFLSEVLDDRTYELQCAVGFSGVVFALKVLTTHYSPPGLHYALGFIPIPSKYIYWAELGLIQLMVPNASFTGHLAGILVGLLYVKGPLKTVMDSFMPAEPSYTYNAGRTGYRRTYTQNGYTTGGARAPYREPSAPYQENYANNHNSEDSRYNDYTGGLSEEEQIRRATEESRRQMGPDPPGNRLYPDIDEIRRRRADRYQ